MLTRLLYASKAVEPLNIDELKGITRTALHYNQLHGITGLLCFANQVFLQALEGNRASVSFLYTKIAKDPRHHHLTLISVQDITERQFPQWSMGLADITQLNPAFLLRYADKTQLNPFDQAAETSLALLKELAHAAHIRS